MTSKIAEEEAHLLPTYTKLPIVLERGKGCWVTASNGRRYLDFYGGHAVAALGHSPTPVVSAISKQAERLLFYSNMAYSPVRARAAKALVSLCGEPGSKVFFCNSGAEANENAMKIARLATGRSVIVATEGSFHGRTAGALAATGIKRYHKPAAGLAADVRHVPFGDLAAADSALTPDAAGLLIEPIQSLAGVVEPPAGYLKELERLARARGVLLIFDEVQTGLGRLGFPSAARTYGVRPDLQTFAKALGSGVPCGAVLATPSAGRAIKAGDLGSTFGGAPLACAAIEATLNEIARLRLWENAASMGALIGSSFLFNGLRRIRGLGLLLGLEFDRPAKSVRDGLLAKGILTGTSEDPNVLRLLPPLTIGISEVTLLREALFEVLHTPARGVQPPLPPPTPPTTRPAPGAGRCTALQRSAARQER